MNKYKLCIIINCVALVAHIINNVFINTLWIGIPFALLSVLTIFIVNTTWFDKLFICKPKDKYKGWDIEHDKLQGKFYPRFKKNNTYRYLRYLPTFQEYMLSSKDAFYGYISYDEALRALNIHLEITTDHIEYITIKPKLDDNLS